MIIRIKRKISIYILIILNSTNSTNRTNNSTTISNPIKNYNKKDEFTFNTIIKVNKENINKINNSNLTNI